MVKDNGCYIRITNTEKFGENVRISCEIVLVETGNETLLDSCDAWNIHKVIERTEYLCERLRIKFLGLY